MLGTGCMGYQPVTDISSMLEYCLLCLPPVGAYREHSMSKGMDKKKETKKKPAKTLEEKRAAKREKKAARG
jgi:hypothetical protein